MVETAELRQLLIATSAVGAKTIRWAFNIGWRWSWPATACSAWLCTDLLWT
jgi:hypothetical protein